MNIEVIKEIINKKVVGKIIAQHDNKGHHYLIGKHILNGMQFQIGKNSVLVDSVTTKLIIEKPHLIKWSIRIAFEWMESRWSTMTSENRDSYLQGAILAHTELRDFAGDVGHQAHKSLEDWANDWINTGERKDISLFFPPEIDKTIPDVIRKPQEVARYRAIAAARSGAAVFLKTGCIPIACELLVGSRRYKSAGTLDMLVWNPETSEIELWDYKSSNNVQDSYALQVAAYKKFFEDMTKLKVGKTKILHLSKDYDKFSLYTIPDIDDAFKAFAAISKVYDWRENGRKKLIRDIKTITI